MKFAVDIPAFILYSITMISKGAVRERTAPFIYTCFQLNNISGGPESWQTLSVL